MTFTTFDIDGRNETGRAIPASETSNPARHTRSRRHRALMGRHISSTRIAGFGF